MRIVLDWESADDELSMPITRNPEPNNTWIKLSDLLVLAHQKALSYNFENVAPISVSGSNPLRRK